nr:MAG TPA: Baseplate component [Caudoviricetes sp.]
MATLKQLTTYINIEMSGETKKYVISAKQGDKATRFIVAKLLNNGEPYQIPSGAQVVVNIKKPDGKHVYNECEYKDADVTIELTNQALAAAGTGICDIEIRSNDSSQVVSSASFEIEIEKSMRSEDAIESSNEFTTLEKKLQKINGAIETINKADAAVKDATAAAEEASAAAKACEGIVSGINMMVDTVTKRACVLSMENGFLTVREA